MSFYERTKSERLRVNNFTLGFGGTSNNAPRCTTCLEQWRLRLQDVNGVRGYVCPGCGQLTPQTADTTTNSSFTTKFGSVQKPHSYIISQSKRNSKDALAEMETQEDIRKITGARAITIKDTQTEEYDTTQQ